MQSAMELPHSCLTVPAHEMSFTLRRATGVTLQHHEILPLPRKISLMIDRNVIYNARSNRRRPPTSPNTAPATKNDSPDESSSHMKYHLHCADQQKSSSNITKPKASSIEKIQSRLNFSIEDGFCLKNNRFFNRSKFSNCDRKINTNLFQKSIDKSVDFFCVSFDFFWLQNILVCPAPRFI